MEQITQSISSVSLVLTFMPANTSTARYSEISKMAGWWVPEKKGKKAKMNKSDARDEAAAIVSIDDPAPAVGPTAPDSVTYNYNQIEPSMPSARYGNDINAPSQGLEASGPWHNLEIEQESVFDHEDLDKELDRLGSCAQSILPFRLAVSVANGRRNGVLATPGGTPNV
ncbi:hypothetical protein P171DRAFT_475323 [Karstenula rhodostoma CBS 690.94]|uniref:Uncharacterized protein n=1 Tax=Karstenula rhodostoma CBS 690.94 TaxID=1392251 RepID=A0A9P4PFD5_9PLEO|nr:hypothetical protein P171DRAFT_475323 [Karstenula rhodostoma CBS 690.94]